MTRPLKIFSVAFLFLGLTITTQTGGIALLIAHYFGKKVKQDFIGKTFLFFCILYLLFTLIVVPILAPLAGREKVNNDIASPANYMTVLLNRNYVTPALNQLLSETYNNLQASNSEVEIHYLDANFPFIDKFPLLPHLSHNDGTKIDLSLIYETPNGNISTKQKSRSGYGAFSEPLASETDQIEKCKRAGYFQYDYPKYLTFGKINKDLSFSIRGTNELINAILKQNQVGKIFIEPHLKQRLGLVDSRIRYHGCGAVRHDDHIHIQL